VAFFLLHYWADLPECPMSEPPNAFDLLDHIGQLAGVGGWELDLATSTLRWTAQTCRIHDLPPDHQPTLDEAIGYYAPAVRTVLEAAVLRGIEQGEGWDLELPMTTATGRQIWVRAHGAVEQRDGRPSRLIGAFQDITERRRDIDALIASERRFRNLFTYSLGLICTHDLEGRLLTVNPAACLSLGYAEAELVGMPLGELMTARDATRVARLSRPYPGTGYRRGTSPLPCAGRWPSRLAIPQRGGYP
jgi:PAS domain-containing protein